MPKRKAKKERGRPSEYDLWFSEAAHQYATGRGTGVKSVSYFEEEGHVVPTIEGFALVVDKCVKTLYNWSKEYPDFLQALEIIKQTQLFHLKNKGLKGEINSTIAKLVLSSDHDMREKTDQTSAGKETGTVDAVIAAMEASRQKR